MQSSNADSTRPHAAADSRAKHGAPGPFVATANRLLVRLASLDFASFEPLSADVAVPHLAAGPFRELDRVLLETLRLSAQGTLQWGPMAPGVAMVLQTAEAMGEGEALGQEASMGTLAGACDEGSVPLFDNAFAQPLAQWAQDAAAVRADDAQSCAARLDAVAHAMAHLMRQRARLRLQAALVSKWGMVACGENARRDARLWLRSLLVALGLNRPDNAAWQVAGLDLLGEALVVRETMMRFRADVLASVDLGLSLAPEDVGLHLRDVHLRIAALRHERHYAAVRVRDRYELGRLQRRLTAWLDGDWTQAAAARQVLLDLAACAQNLEEINERDVLCAHDRQVQGEALALLDTLGVAAAKAPMHTLQALLERLRWRSQELATFLGDHDELATGTDAPAEPAEMTPQHVAALRAIVERVMELGRG